MQIGKRITDIVEPTDVFRQQDIDAKERVRSEERFVHLCRELFANYPDNIREYYTAGDTGPELIQESALCIISGNGDASYLHVLPFCSSDEEGEYEFGIAIEEYDDKGRKKDGYVYHYDAKEFVRTPIKFVEGDTEPKENPQRFSVIDLYTERDNLDLLRMSDIEAVKNRAEADYQMLQADDASELWREDLGCVPLSEEIKKLSGILALAQPYASRES